MTLLNVGDLAQYKLSEAHGRPFWKELPVTHHDFQIKKYNLTFLMYNPLDPEEDIYPNWSQFNGIRMAQTEFKNTKKTCLLITDIVDVVHTHSRNPQLRKMATKRFAKVMAMSKELTGQLGWVLLDHIEPFEDKTYLDGLKIQLLKKVSNT